MTILYVSGLGDRYDGFRCFCLIFWKLWGTDVKLVPMKWFGPESYEDKLTRLEHAVMKYDKVILVGESAGATMVLHLAEKHLSNVAGYTTLCGVCSSTMPIHPRLKLHSPAFEKATRSLSGDYPIDKVRNFRAWRDPVVTKKYSSIKGAEVTTIASAGHFFTIVLSLTLYSPWFIYRLRKT